MCVLPTSPQATVVGIAAHRALVRRGLSPVREARRGKHPDGAPPHPLRPGGVHGRRAKVELAV